MWEVPQACRWWVTKMISRHFTHGKNMVRWQQRTSSDCLHCHNPLEDKAHILQCQALMAKEQWITSVTALQQWMKDLGADPLLTRTLISWLQTWQTNEPQPNNNIPLLDQQQSAIGWERMLDGWLSKSWQEHQEHYWSHMRTW